MIVKKKQESMVQAEVGIIHFQITKQFAEDCLRSVGSVVRHDQLGLLFCDEVSIRPDGSIGKVVFLGTCNTNGLRNLSR